MLKRGDASPLVGGGSGEPWSLGALLGAAAGLIACQGLSQSCIVPLLDQKTGNKSLEDFKTGEVSKP